MPPRVDELTDKLICREASPEEARRLFSTPEGCETVCWVLIRGVAVVGHVYLTKIAGEWYGHDYIPFDQGENFAFLGGTDWDASQVTLPADIR